MTHFWPMISLILLVLGVAGSLNDFYKNIAGEKSFQLSYGEFVKVFTVGHLTNHGEFVPDQIEIGVQSKELLANMTAATRHRFQKGRHWYGEKNAKVKNITRVGQLSRYRVQMGDSKDTTFIAIHGVTKHDHTLSSEGMKQLMMDPNMIQLIELIIQDGKTPMMVMNWFQPRNCVKLQRSMVSTLYNVWMYDGTVPQQRIVPWFNGYVSYCRCIGVNLIQLHSPKNIQ